MHRVATPNHLRGLTLIELLVVIFIISVLAGALMPVVWQVRARAKSTMCVSNMRQVLLGLQMYATDYTDIPLDWDGEVRDEDGDIIRPGLLWAAAALPYVGSKEAFLCPGDPTKGAFAARGIPCSWPYSYTTAAVEAFGGEGKTVALESPILLCHWCVDGTTIVIGRKDTSVEVAPLARYPGPLQVVFE